MLVSKYEGKIVNMTGKAAEWKLDSVTALNRFFDGVFWLSVKQADSRAIGCNYITWHVIVPTGANEIRNATLGL